MGVSNTKLRTQRLDRAATALKVATATFKGVNTGNTGSIENASAVAVQMDGGTPCTGTQQVPGGAQFAIPCNFSPLPAADPAQSELTWNVNNQTLSVKGPNGYEGTITFWVF